MHPKLLVPRPEKTDLCSWWRSHASRGYSEVSSLLLHGTLTEPLLVFYSVTSFQDPITGLSTWQLTSLQLYITSHQCDGLLRHIMATSNFFFISCCLLFLNLSPGCTLAIFKRYSLSSKLVGLCAHTPPTAESFYH